MPVLVGVGGIAALAGLVLLLLLVANGGAPRRGSFVGAFRASVSDGPGEEYCFFYRSKEATMEIIAGEGQQPLDIGEMTAARYVPDTRYKDQTCQFFER